MGWRIDNLDSELFISDSVTKVAAYHKKEGLKVSSNGDQIIITSENGGVIFSQEASKIDSPSVNGVLDILSVIHGYISTSGVYGFSGGWADYNDVTTTGTPIAVTAVPAVLTNDGLGVNTKTAYLPIGGNGITQLWDTSSNGFDFSDLNVGDMLDIRMDISVVIASVNTVVDINLLMGTGGSIVVPFISDQNYKATGTFEVIRYMGLYIGSEDVRDTLAQLKIEADKSCTCIVHGWYIKATRRG
jgi:hypothetical protein